MEISKESGLRVGHKLELLLALLHRKTIRSILDSLTVQQLVEAHSFLWELLVEIHYLTQQGDFVREVVTGNMMDSAEYQRQQNCELRIDYCKGVECISSNPVCAGNKVKNNMEVMARTIISHIDHCSAKHQQRTIQHEELKTWY